MIKVDMQTSVSINQSKVGPCGQPSLIPTSLFGAFLTPGIKGVAKPFFCTSASVNLGGSEREPVYAHGNINVNLRSDERSSRQTQAVVSSSSSTELKRASSRHAKVQPTRRRWGCTAAIS